MLVRVLAFIALVSVAAGCGSGAGSTRVVLTFENESRTRCVRVSVRAPNGASLNAVPTALDRAGDQLVIGIAETPELVGELQVTVARFDQAGCPGTPFATETRSVVLSSGAASTLEFTFRDEAIADGGTDAGTADAGDPDAGTCEVSSCAAPSECQAQALACLAPGTCTYEPRAPGTACGDGGVCSGGACVPDTCAVQPPGAACDDQLPCTSASSCMGGLCVASQCAMTPPACQRIRQPVIACDANTPAFCQLEADPAQDGAACQGGVGRCLGGECRPWLPVGFSPRFFDLGITEVPYPTEGWSLGSPDGGRCAVVLNTGPAALPFVEDGGCGLPAITTRVSADGGLALFTMTGLRVDPLVELHFAGTRPAQLLVLGDATIDGLVSVAPQLPGARPAGAHPTDCLDAGSGDTDDEGGGGGGFGASGGAGWGNPGPLPGGAAASLARLRGGCGGGNGFQSGSFVPGGVGGGAIDLIVSGTLTVRNGGAVTASGGGGAAGVGDKRGGGGGGSGGMVVLEANVLQLLDGGAATANGGSGGEGGKNGETSAAGPFGSFTTAQRVAAVGTSPGGGNGGRGGAGPGPDAAGEVGLTGTGSGNPGGGGGGGGVGVVHVYGRLSCTSASTGGVVSGAHPEAISCP